MTTMHGFSNTRSPNTVSAGEMLCITVLLLCAFTIRWFVAPSNGYNGMEGGFLEYKQAMHRVLTLGMHEAYTTNANNDPAMTGVEWDGSFFITNPPGRLYAYLPSVLVYRHFSPDGFNLWPAELNFFKDLWRNGFKVRLDKSRGFSVALKLPAMLADMAIALGLFLFLKSYLTQTQALLASAIFAMNPGVIIDTAHFGSHDTVAIALVVLSLWLINRARLEWAAAAFVLAALNKPQAAAFAPFMIFVGLKFFPVPRFFQSLAIGFITALLIFLPFILHGTLSVTISALIHATFGGEPFISMDANNLWWLVSLGRGQDVSDTTLVWGLFSFRSLGLVMFCLANMFVLHRLSLLPLSAPRLFLGAAVIGMSYFMLNTETHENHMMSVLPLLLFALPCHQKIWGLVLAIFTTLSLNFILFDSSFFPFLNDTLGLHAKIIHRLSIASSAVNVLIFGAMLYLVYAQSKHSILSDTAKKLSKKCSAFEMIFLCAVLLSLFAVVQIIHPKKIIREYPVMLNNPQINNREDFFHAIQQTKVYEKAVEEHVRRLNMSSSDLIEHVDTEVDFHSATDHATVLLRFTVVESEFVTMRQLEPLFEQLQERIADQLNDSH